MIIIHRDLAINNWAKNSSKKKSVYIWHTDLEVIMVRLYENYRGASL